MRAHCLQRVVLTMLALSHSIIVQSYIMQLGASLNHAASIALNAPQDLRKSQYVAAITPVKGIPFYEIGRAHV